MNPLNTLAVLLMTLTALAAGAVLPGPELVPRCLAQGSCRTNGACCSKSCIEGVCLFYCHHLWSHVS
jgi:hypothetical protein